MQFKDTLTQTVNWLKSHKLATGIILAIVVIIILIASGGDNQSVESYVVVKKDITFEAELSGRTKSGSQVDLGFADTGRVAMVNVQEGDAVYRGQTLASLELGDLIAELADAKASVVIAQSEVTTSNTDLEKITSEQNTLVANAKKTLLSDDLEVVADYSGTAATSPVITGDYFGKEGQYTIRVYKSGTTSGYSFEVGGLEANFTGAVETTQAVSLGSKGLYIRFPDTVGYGNTTWSIDIPNKRGSAYTTNYNAYQSALATRDRVIAAAENDLRTASGNDSVLAAKVAQAEARVQGVQARIAKRLITAPFDGTVATVAIEPGETSAADSTITLISKSDYEVVVKVPELDINKLSVGQKASIALDAYPGESFPGTIASINPAESIIDGVPVYEAKVMFDRIDPRVRSGMTATAKVQTTTQLGVIAVPTRLIQMKNGETLAYVQEGERTKAQPVVLGLKGSDGFVEVISGLVEGQTIVTPPAI